ncbi:hypothetical protein GCM10027047_34090 [Rhodococcus aerolatus]
MDVWTVEQLVAAGHSRSTIYRRCRAGTWRRLLPGLVATADPGFATLCRALVLWQPRAVLSHRSAAHLWGFHDVPQVVEATVSRTANVRTPPWLVLHRRLLDPSAVTERNGFRVVTRDRAVLDCQTVLTPDDADRLTDSAVAVFLGPRTLAAGCERDAGVAGVVAARRQVRHAAVGARSEAERRVARALAARGWPMAANRSVLGWVCDFVDELAKVVVEIDGREVHSEPRVFREERRRHNAITAAGWHVQRYAGHDAMVDPDGVAAEVIELCRRRRAARR